MLRPLVLAISLAGPSLADTVVAARTIRPHSIIGAQDLAVRSGSVPGATADPAAIIGQEARVALYAGRPIHPGDVGPPAVIERNQLVPLVFHGDGLRISVEGRALDRAGAGDVVRVMNLSSRQTVFGRATADGHVNVSR